MKYSSQDNEVMIKFVVYCGDWEIIPDPDDLDKPATPSTTKIDDRTVRARIFPSLKEATDYAQSVLKNHQDDKWLAYVEIKECTTKVVNKLK